MQATNKVKKMNRKTPTELKTDWEEKQDRSRKSGKVWTELILS